MDLRPADIIGNLDNKYYLRALVADGGSCKVFLGERIDYQKSEQPRFVAIKIFESSFLHDESGLGKVAICAEHMTLTKLDHPNIVKLLDYGADGKLFTPVQTIEGPVYFVTEFISNGTLLSLIKS